MNRDMRLGICQVPDVQ